MRRNYSETGCLNKVWNQTRYYRATEVRHFYLQILQEGKIRNYIDGKDPLHSNWMCFVNCARCEDEQNIIAYQYHGEIYYRVYKEIQENDELLVWYGDEYAEQLGIPLYNDEQNQEATNFGGIKWKWRI